LRLLRLSRLSDSEREVVRTQRDPGLVYLDPERFDLPDENAAVVAALVRVHHSAIDPTPVGQLDASELRVLHERVCRHYGFDLQALVREEIERLAQRARGSAG